MTIIEDVVKFKCGHKEFKFPRSALVYYKWLDHLFGNGLVHNPRKELRYNLIDYLTGIQPQTIRQILDIISYLESLYDETRPTIKWNQDYDMLSNVEHFLSNGPGVTKGLNVPYKCKICDKESYYKSYRERNPHRIIQHNKQSICVNCGINWADSIPKKAIFCSFSYFPQDDCDHEWE